jgi:FeS assembly protein IscX
MEKTTMPANLDWSDTENIAILLANRYPDIDPLGASLAQLQEWITGLEELGGNQGASEAQLEDIRIAWHDEYTTRHWDAGPNPIFPF